jgi:TPR repeat protein
MGVIGSPPLAGAQGLASLDAPLGARLAPLGGRLAAVVVACLLAVPTLAAATPAAPPCTDFAACEAACKDGAGSGPACTAVADALMTGKRVLPDRKRAATLYKAACKLPADGEPPAADGDPAACMALADLTKAGWLFDVEKDPALHRTLVDRAVVLSASRCTEADPSGCAVAARAAQSKLALAPPGAVDPGAAQKLAELGCSKASDLAACSMLFKIAASQDKPSEAQRVRGVAHAGIADACVKGNGLACSATPVREPRVRAAIEKHCADGNVDACGVLQIQLVGEHRKDAEKQKAAAAELVKLCAGDGFYLCAAVAERLLEEKEKVGFVPDHPNGIAIATRRCELGDRDACRALHDAYSPTGPATLRDAAKSRQWGERACILTSPDLRCRVCDLEPTVPECQRRAAFVEHERCHDGVVGACELVGGRFRDGTGVDKDVTRAAKYLRRGCDAAEKSACVALDELCLAEPALADDVCHQALIHTDLFYEAEYQLENRGAAGLVDPNAPPAAGGSTVTVAGTTTSSAGIELRRGKLDADLVVDIVLDRARQAAIKLVVDELVSAEDRARYRYLADLLDQGARLLADPSTLRREKFQDLGMTVVRAFVASNLIDSLYPTADELVKAPAIGPIVKGQLDLVAGEELPPVVHGYLVDVAYRWLGETRLFGRNPSQDAEVPPCPWTECAGATLCTALAERATVERALRVDKVLDGVRLAKALREIGFDELRRLIEAVSRSRAIADLGKTPGLNLAAWRSELVAGTRERVSVLRGQIADLRALLRPAAYADNGPDAAALGLRAVGARAALDSKAIRLVIGSSNASYTMRLVTMIERAAPKEKDKDKAGPPGPPAPPSGPAPAGPRNTPVVVTPPATDAETLGKLRKDSTTLLTTWGAKELAELGKKLDRVEANLDALPPTVDQLETAIADVNAVFARFPRPDGSVSLDVGILPLYAIGDLTRNLRTAVTTLATLETQLHRVYPGEIQAQLKFARSATVRLLGFLDLMERVARSSRLTQTCGDVVGALGTLGSFRAGEFTAPLYDVLEPVLGAIKTHEPMSLDMLFAVIARVRLDTLVGSLQGSGNACKDDGGVDCWTVKLIHALQESVEREGDLIRVDGGKFAQRLARHGDDFRRKHEWRGYFHLTVGFGGMLSDPVGDAGSARRTVPLISEQVGFGWASPSFFGDRLTFKIGAAASGLLYRAVLDSEESDAIMVHPILFAVDVGALVEAYVSPAMVLVYPPNDTRDTAMRWAFGAGLSVPLGAYLERLQ